MALSTSLHGGLALYDWSANPADGHLAHAPVAVSLLPAVDVASLAQEEAPLVSEETSSGPVPQQVVKETTQPEPIIASTPDVRGERKAADQPLTSDTADLAAVERNVDVPQPEVTHTVAHSRLAEAIQALPENNPSNVEQMAADVKPFEAVNKLRPAALLRIEEGLLTGQASTNAELVQAVPNYRSNPLPEYPYQARKQHWEGVVWLLVDVSADGSVEELRVEKSCGHRVLDRTASRAVKRWQFTPAKRAGLPVLSQVRIPVRFHLEEN